MARRKSTNGSAETPVSIFQHSEARLNIPDATETRSGLPKGKKQTYYYSPHLTPKLQFDSTGIWDQVLAIVEKAVAGQKLTKEEAEILRLVGQQGAQPWLEWATKQEQQARGSFAVDDVVLHVHERVSAQAILTAARRRDISEQDFFARPNLHREQALQYYQHNVDWANRLILGDSLQVMGSLVNRENLGGQVQTIYLDPPYGIKFSSNWQNEMGNRDVKDKETDLTREPEMVKAYRDTWTLGVHSYLAYLRDRLMLCKELLADTGSIFVQISDENLHRVRCVMDEVFAPENCLGIIAFVTTGGQSAELLGNVFDFLLWYGRDKTRTKYRQLFFEKQLREGGGWAHSRIEFEDGRRENVGVSEVRRLLSEGRKVRPYSQDGLASQGATTLGGEAFEFEGRQFVPPNNSHWKTNSVGMKRLQGAQRIEASENSVRYVRFLDDFPVQPIINIWDDTNRPGYIDAKRYIVQTSAKVIERCLLMTTDPGDLVLDPTCGGGTTAYVAEQWGRRWITIDTSRVALALARQRVLTACYDSYKTKDPIAGVDPSAPQNPAYGFYYKTVPHITLKSIAQNRHLDPIFDKHEIILASALANLNATLARDCTEPTLHAKLVGKLAAKVASDGASNISISDLRRWLLPGTDAALINFGTPAQQSKWSRAIPVGPGWQDWETPFDIDPDWPETLQRSLNAYRDAWRAKMDEVNAAIKANAEREKLVDQPELVRGVSRVSGPFSVEGVRPEELTLGEDGKLSNQIADSVVSAGSVNADAYIDLMIKLLLKDGVSFLGNRHLEFASLEKEVGKSFHARGRWKGKEEGEETIAVVFGPQYGPMNAPMTAEAIDAARGITAITELVLAGFSFDAAAQEKAKELDSSSLRIHLAHIRPDVSPGMQGLLKQTPKSQLFTVFGQPDIRVVPAGDGELKVEMNGVCIYNPLTGEISESSNKKVAAWFLDCDYDGHCFCISQAFFPNKDAWEKIARALGSSVSSANFDDFTTSWPFKSGKHRRIAVKVIDPRGNEVIAIQPLNP